MADLVGQQFGSYRLLRLLGHSTSADVYEAEHVRFATRVAIKVQSDRISDEEYTDQFRSIARLRHPHIVRVIDFDVQNGARFLVMEYAPSGSLRQRHPGGTQVPLTLVVSYVRQVADALQYAHDQKIIHRNLKPENMLLGRNQQILLTDFGISVATATSASSATLAQSILGTYMAPEQVQGKPRPASDQYSLAAIVYEWLTGRLPFHGSTTVAMLMQHLQAPPPPLRALIPTLPADVEEVVLIALAKDHRARFGSIQAFATALEQASGRYPISTQPGSSQPAGFASLPAAAWGQLDNSQRQRPQDQDLMTLGCLPPLQGNPQSTPKTPPLSTNTPPLPNALPLPPPLPIPPKSGGHIGSDLLKNMASVSRRIFSPTKSTRNNLPQLSLFAVARVHIENNDQVIVGKFYSAEAGISQSAPAGFAAEPFTISTRNPDEPIPFDILMHPGNNVILEEPAHRHLSYNPHAGDAQFLLFPFKVVAPGQTSITVNFYHRQCWLKTVKLTFEAQPVFAGTRI